MWKWSDAERPRGGAARDDMGGSSGAAARPRRGHRWRAVAVQVATHRDRAVRSTPRGRSGRWPAAWCSFGVVAAIQLRRFTRLNGVRVGGFASQGRASGRPTTASLRRRPGRSRCVAYAAAVARPLVARWCCLGGRRAFVYVLSGRRWLRAYRQEPARVGAGESALWIALAVGLAVAGLVLLVLER